MPLDSIYLQNESSMADSSVVADTVQIIQGVSVRYEGIKYLSFPESENWVFCVLFGLFFLLVFAVRMYPSIFAEDMRSIFRIKERSSIFSNPEGNDSRFRVLFIFFAFCVLSLYAYFIMFEPEQGGFTMLTYLLFFLTTSVFFLLKYFFIWLLNFIFFDRKTLKISVKSYFDLIIFFGLALFPLLIVNIYTIPSVSYFAVILSIIVSIFTAVFIVLKLFQIFFSKLLDSFYILLYLCTLEILPLMVLFRVYQLIV